MPIRTLDLPVDRQRVDTTHREATSADAIPLSPTIDNLVRAIVALTLDGERFPIDSLAAIEGQTGPMKLVVRVDDRGAWRRAA